jgi:hypothetical protein
MELAGRAVGIDHDVAILSGGSGAKTFAHTFDFFLRSGTSWTFQETIEPDLGWDFNGDGCDRAALEDDTAIVASYDAGYDGSGRGRASVYRFTTPP